MNLVPRIPSKKSALQKIFGYVPLNLHLRSKKPPLHPGQRSAPLGSVTPFLIQVLFGLHYTTKFELTSSPVVNISAPRPASRPALRYVSTRPSAPAARPARPSPRRPSPFV